ncbi:hypothetical protein VNI00_018759 [Paramarasmius palmivorus]|uniref:HMG domain-containing protein n=1 Tax=Paramarasmius palmivorus TaxID=297713 RepID=A0AAW0AV01_9AGAR
MASSKRPWALDPCPEEAPKRMKFPGHSKEFVKSPTKRLAATQHRKTNRSKPAKCPQPLTKERSTGVESQVSGSPTPQEPIMDPPALHDAEHMELEGLGAAEMGTLDEEEAYDDFVQLVDEQYIAFVQVTTFLYVVQGFDSERRCGTALFYHLEARKSGEIDVRLSCLCPEGKKGDCFHKKFYRDFRESRFRMNEDAIKAEGTVVLFLRQMVGMDDEAWVNRFSVAYDSHSNAIRSRTIVTYEGSDSGGGKWSCIKCAVQCCAHMRKAKRLLDMIVGNLDDLSDAEGGEMSSFDETNEMYMVDSANTRSTDERAISYLPILPPAWASLPEDHDLYPRPSPIQPLPPVLSLESTSRTACGRHLYDPTRTVIQRDCTIYGLVGQSKHLICMQSCPSCPAVQRCFVGPDARTLGVFNLNNSVLFTHELLDDYTNRYTSSETPFASFVVSMARIYAGRNDKFVGEDLFRGAWFAFASLQHMAGDMWCPQCGEAPDTMIFDGVTTGFAKRHLRETLSPPTTIPPNPLVHHRTRHSGLQWLPGSNSKGPCTREKLANWIKRWGDKGLLPSPEHEQRKGELLVLENELEAMGASAIGKLLTTIYVLDAGKQDPKVRRRYRTVFEQLSANESALQMVNSLGLQSLKRFVEKPSVASASLLLDIPALMLVVEPAVRAVHHVKLIVDLCQWMAQRAEEVLTMLTQGNYEGLEDIRNSNDNGDNWKEVC